MSLLVNFTPYNSDNVDKLAEKWIALEQYGDNDFFLSWAWISSWLATVQSELILVEAIENRQTVGLAILAQVERKVFGTFPIKRWLLHRTGKPEDDQPWIEYNTFLALNADVQRQMAEAIINNSQWQELVIGLAEVQVLLPFEQYLLNKHTVLESPGYKVNYQLIEKDYSLEVISKNCRQKIKKNTKLLENIGRVDFEIFTQKRDVISRMEAISAFHIERWQNTKTKSGFENPKFNHFLKALINNETNVKTHLSCLKVNKTEVAYLLNFVVNKKVYFYLSAIDQKFEPMINKGIVIHYQTVEYYYQQGYIEYDFLLGEQRFKNSLANSHYQQQMKCYFKNSVTLVFENALRKLKSMFIN